MGSMMRWYDVVTGLGVGVSYGAIWAVGEIFWGEAAYDWFAVGVTAAFVWYMAKGK